MNKDFQKLTIKDNFMFAAVMSDPASCKELLELILRIRILEITVITERTMSYHPEYKGIRLDVLAEEIDGIRRKFNVEMQVKDLKNLPKRSRYYHSHIDMESLLRGEADYNKLPDTYVIFICDFKIFDGKRFYYTFTSTCKENKNIYLDNGQTTIFLSTKGTEEERKEISSELVQFLKYVESPEKNIEENNYIRKIKEMVQKIKKDRNWEEKYMLLQEMLKEEREAGIEIGRKESAEKLKEAEAKCQEAEAKRQEAEAKQLENEANLQHANAEIERLRNLLQNTNK